MSARVVMASGPDLLATGQLTASFLFLLDNLILIKSASHSSGDAQEASEETNFCGNLIL